MHISLNWLKDYVDIEMDPQELGQLLTLKTAEVEGVENQAESFENMVTGKIIKLEKHPDADKLQVAIVDVGEKEALQIVCGGSNLSEGMSVAITKIGSKVKWHGEGDLITLEAAKVRGVESQGMIAAGVEIGIEDPGAGERDILDLSDKNPKPGTPLAELFNKNDQVFEIDNKSLTHRPDLWGHYGIAREVAAITNKALKPLEVKVQIPEQGEQIAVKIEDHELCPRFCALLIKNVKVADSPEWLKARLQAIGHGTHSNIVDVTNYIMADLGQPMHAFDHKKIQGGIVVRTAKEGEKLTTLDGKEHKLNSKIGVVADHKGAVSVAGVIGGANSEIDENTVDIILEAANWHPTRLRRTSIEIGTRTDAVQRFEKSLDPNLPEIAIKKAAELILQICPDAEIAGPITDEGTFTNKEIKVELDTEKARKKIGVEIPDQDIVKNLEKLEFKLTKKSENLYEVLVPSFRATKDVSIEDDLIEEIARIFGYDNIPPTLPTLPTKLPEENHERKHKHLARELFSYGLGFNEVYNYSFYGQEEMNNCLIPDENHVLLDNYLSADQTHMRTTLIPNLLKNLVHNSKYFDQIKIYEIGHTYKDIGEYMPLEEKRLGGAILHKGKDQDEIFYQCKAVVEQFFDRFHLPRPEMAKGVKNSPYAHPNKAVSYIDHNGQTLGRVFIVHPLVARNHDLENYSIALFDINFSEALKLEKIEHKYRPIAKFPSIEFDVSVLIDREIEVATLQTAIEKANPELISAVELFDIYQGDRIEADKKAVAFKITLQAPDRTLTEEDMSTSQKQVFKNLEELGGKIRGA